MSARLLVLTLLLSGGVAQAHGRPVADVIYWNGHVETLDDAFSHAEALAVKDGRILAVGGSLDVLFRFAGFGTRFIDLHGRALLPGFVDAHTHLLNDHESLGLTVEEAQALGLAQGITTLGELFVNPAIYDEITGFAATGSLQIRTSLYLVYANPCGVVLGDWYLAHPPLRDPEAMLRTPGIKIFTDGGSCGASANTFSFDPPQDPPFGDLWFEQAMLDAAVAQADAAGYQVAIHALGDRGRDEALTAIDHALAGRANVLRHRIEHDTFMRPDQIGRYTSLGVVATAFGAQTCLQEADPIEDHIPDFALPFFHPVPAMLSAGVAVAWHSDFPFRPIDTFRYHLYNLVTRQQVDEDGVTICVPDAFLAAGRVTTRQALRMMTLASAYALHMDGAVGSLEPGKLADLIVVSHDPLRVAPDALKDLAVLSTVVGGVPRYCAAGHERFCR
jgi:predicted amidohydrolase YtcJ